MERDNSYREELGQERFGKVSKERVRNHILDLFTDNSVDILERRYILSSLNKIPYKDVLFALEELVRTKQLETVTKYNGRQNAFLPTDFYRKLY
jgi:hypothetical protein